MNTIFSTLKNTRWRDAFGVSLSLLLCAGCSTQNAFVQTDLAAEAGRNYRAGMDDLISGNYSEAITSFRKVAKAPRYVVWSPLAVLRIGDSLFFSEKYQEAASQYEAFLLQYQGDPNEAHAQFGMSRSYVEQIPSDMWMLPPPYERERDSLNRSRKELELYLERYPQDRHYGEAKEMLERVKDLQFSFIAYVASYYENREEYAGLIVRTEEALSSFPSRARAGNMDLRLARAYLDSDRIGDALRVYKSHLELAPNSPDKDIVDGWIQKLETILEEKAVETAPVEPAKKSLEDSQSDAVEE